MSLGFFDKSKIEARKLKIVSLSSSKRKKRSIISGDEMEEDHSIYSKPPSDYDEFPEPDGTFVSESYRNVYGSEGSGTDYGGIDYTIDDSITFQLCRRTHVDFCDGMRVLYFVVIARRCHERS